MSKLKLVVIVLSVIVFSAFITYKAVNWKVKDDYGIYIYQGGSKFITFKGLNATIILDEEDMTKSKISASVNSDIILVEPNQALENAGESTDALDVKNFPFISFESASVVAKWGTGYEAIGKLTIKNVSKEITIPFTFENEVLKGTFNVNLSDFNINHKAFTKTLQIFLNIPVAK